MLPEIIITCNIRGLLRINDRIIGEVRSDTYESFIGAGSFYLSMTPLEHDHIYAPITVKISTDSGAPVYQCPYIHMYNYSGNSYMLELIPPIIAGSTLPKCLAYEKVNSRFVASLMEQSSHYLVIEDEQKHLPDGFFPLKFKNTPSLFQTSLENTSIIIATDSNSTLYAFVLASDGYKPALNLEATSWEKEDDAISITKTTTYNHTITNVYKLQQSELTLVDTTYKIASSPLIGNEIVQDFLECMKYGIGEKAVSYLSHDLNLTFEELKEFLGEFSQFKASPFEENAYALIGKNKEGSFLAGRFSFELTGGKIYNIEEL